MEETIIYGVLIAVSAFALDLAFGEPSNRFHPVAWMGRFISAIDCRIPRGRGGERAFGIALTLVTILFFVLIFTLLLAGIRVFVSALLWGLLCAILLKMMFAIRSLFLHVRPIQEALEAGDIDLARKGTRMVVSREVEDLDTPHLISCASETVAENLVDSIISPLFYMGLGGLPAAIGLRAVNTMDAMVGYENERNLKVGWFPARLDDVLHFIPARLSVPFILLALRIRGKDWRSGHAAAIRDHVRTKSPNKGWPMAAVAGGLRFRMEKKGNYLLGEGDLPQDPELIMETYRVVRLTALIFFFTFALPLFVFVGIQVQLFIENLLLSPF